MSVRPRVSKARASKSTQRKKKLEDASSEDSEDAKNILNVSDKTFNYRSDDEHLCKPLFKN